MSAKIQNLQTALNTISSLQAKAAEVRNEIEQLIQSQSKLSGDAASISADLEKILVADVRNEPQMAILLNAALWHRDRALDSLRSEVAMLLRSYAYYTGRSFALPAKQPSLWILDPDELIKIQERDPAELNSFLTRTYLKIV